MSGPEKGFGKTTPKIVDHKKAVGSILALSYRKSTRIKGVGARKGLWQNKNDPKKIVYQKKARPQRATRKCADARRLRK
jgi:hypothetical protein